MPDCEGKNEMDGTKTSKKPFNKKKWREQKYSCKAKVQRWENIKRKQAQRQYAREFKKLHMNEKPLIQSQQCKSSNYEPNGNKPLSRLKQAVMQYTQEQKIKEEKRKEQERIKKEKIEAIKLYKQKKAEKFKKLSQKTKRGQPLMKGRIELLLEEIQKKYVNQDG